VNILVIHINEAIIEEIGEIIEVEDIIKIQMGKEITIIIEVIIEEIIEAVGDAVDIKTKTIITRCSNK